MGAKIVERSIKSRMLVFLLFVLVVQVFGTMDSPNHPALAAQPVAIESLEEITLGGVKQTILIRGKDISNPILLWLHGGPGTSAMLLSHYCMNQLEEHFIVVNWDQRGAGFSYRKDLDPDTISVPQLLSDTHELTRMLLKRFRQPKIYILGHSFGSILGIRTVARYPEDYYAYIGMGQVIDPIRSEKIVYQWLQHQMQITKDEEGLAEIKKSRFPNPDLIKKYKGIIYKNIDYYGIIKSSPYYSSGYLDRYNEAIAFTNQAIRRNEMMRKMDNFLLEIPRLDLPVYFFEGRHDHGLSTTTELVVEYCRKLKASRKKICWFEESGHLPNIDEPDNFQKMIIQGVLPETYGL